MKKNNGVDVGKEFKINGKHAEAGRDTPDDAFKGYMLYELRDLKVDTRKFREEYRDDLKEMRRVIEKNTTDNNELFKTLATKVANLEIFKSNVYVIVTVVSVVIGSIFAIVF